MDKLNQLSKMQKSKIVMQHIFIWWCGYVVGEVKDELPVDWWCDETECFYKDSMLMDVKCETNNSIPYYFNYTTGTCELNLKGLLLSLRAINNRLGKITEERNRKRADIFFQRVITSGNIFVVFASVCVFLACFYCGWVQYTDRQLAKSIKSSKKLQARLKLNVAKQNTGTTERVKTGKINKCKTSVEVADVQTSTV